MTAMLTDAHFIGSGLVIALGEWDLIAAVIAPLIGRLLAHQSQPTLADRLRAVQSERPDALAREAGRR